jgi:hypothetical protein
MSDRVLMKKKLAQALMEAGMEHYDSGGLIGGLTDFLGASNRYQAQAPEIQRQNFVPRIGELQQNQNQVLSQQQALANALLAQSQGGGPNPALAQLNQATGQNVANQAALMAGARGANANPALIARLAAQQGAGIQQNAVGQAATMQAQQQLQAQQALAQIQNQMAQQALQGESIQQGGVAAQNTAVTTGQLGANNINAQSAAQNAKQNAGILGGLIGGAASIFSGGFAHGGEIPKMAGGGVMGIENYQAPTQYALPQWINPLADDEGGMNQGLATLAKALKKKQNPGAQVGGEMGADLGASIFNEPATPVMAQAPMAAPMSMPGGMTGMGSVGAAMYALGGDVVDATPGGKVPGRAVVGGDSEKNDIQPALLSPGEVVIPRSIAQGPNAPDKAAEFIKQIQGQAKGYGKVVQARKSLKDRVEYLEKLCMGGKVK